MADRKQLKIADQANIADDDPFAELTRIMGFDPREPVRRQAVSAPTTEAHDGFGIDLEKELMGEFDDFDEVAANDSVASIPASLISPQSEAKPVQPSVVVDSSDAIEQAPARETADTDFFSSLEKTFRFDDAGNSASSASGFTVSEQPAPAAEQHDEDISLNLAVDELDQTAPAMDFVAATDHDDFDAVFADVVGQEFEPEADAAANEVVAETAVAAQPEAAELEFADEDFGFDVPDHEEPAVSQVDAPQPSMASDAHGDDFGMHFDQAMADFDADEPEPVMASVDAPAAKSTAELPPVAAIAPLPPAPQAPAASSENLADELDLDFDQAFAGMADEPAESAAPAPQPAAASMPVFEAPVAAAPPVFMPAPAAPAPLAAAPSLRDSTLEDELNALLSRMKARPVVAAPETADRWRSQATPVASAPQPATPIMAEPPRPAPAAPAVTQNRPFEWTRASMPVQSKPTEPVASEEELDTALMADLGDLSTGFDAADDTADFDFDDHAFDAAFAAEMKQAHAAPAATVSARPSADRQDWSTKASPAPASASVQPAQWNPASRAPAPAAREVPDIETIDVPERVVALADDLDIPDLVFDDEPAEAQGFDDLDTEFASLLNDMNAVDIAGTSTSSRKASYDDDAYANYAAARTAPAANVYAQTPQAAGYETAGQQQALDDPFEGDFDFSQPESTAIPEAAFVARRPRRRGLLVAGIVGAVAVAGGLGALAFSFGGKSHGDAPAIVKADNQPIKVKPENPGGTVIPNQDSKVYDAVAKGAQPVEPAQQKLVTTAEEPVDVKAPQPDRVIDMNAGNGGTDAATATAQSADAAPAVKSEDRVQPTDQDSTQATGQDATPVVSPRKVRTMTVKADGSLVPSEAPAAKVAATEPTDPAPQHVSGATGDQTGAVSAAPDAPAPALAPVASAADKAAADAKPVSKMRSTPALAPVAPQRPSDQPVNIVGEVKPDQVASIPTTDTSAPAGTWAMQIASQPTAEGAQSTYQDLARRYSSVLNGRGVNIVKAEVAGKGTFYRVRVPAQSRNDAVDLCTSYKAAGGNCFVSK